MKILKILTACALMFSAAVALADPPAQVGRLNYLAGGVSLAPEANDEWSAAILNRPLTTGDRLWTGADGRAEMHIGSTAIRIPALTSLDVLSLDERGTQLRLAQGGVNVRLRRLDAGENFEISTPSGAVLLTQPGSYRVIVDPSGTSTTIVAHRGEADVLTGGAPFTVREGQLATISDHARQIFSVPPLDEFDNWSAARDRREDNLAAVRYVPREMTGYEDLDQYGTWDNAEQYGAVWYPAAVPADWAPFRHGHWVWVSPWGWTWVDDAPWGFAPSHYGRWVRMGHRWAWAPGARVVRPVYAPAIVAFIGGGNWSVSIGSGPAVGWVPLGWREPYIPWYRSSPAYVRNVNATHVTNINVINQYSNVRNVNNIRYVNRGVPSATTVVPRDAFVAGQRADRALVRVPAQVLANARITHEAPVTRPERARSTTSRPAPRVPAAIAAREVLAVKAPPEPANERREDRPRVRVIGPQSPRADPPARSPEAESRAVPDQSRPQVDQRRQPPPSQGQGAPTPQEERQRQLQQQRVQLEQQQRAQQERVQREQQNAQERQQRDQQQAVQRAQQEERERQQQRAQQEQQQRALQEQQKARERQLREQQQASQRAQQEERQRQPQQQIQREQRQVDRAAEDGRPQPLPQARPPQPRAQPEKPMPPQRQQREPFRNGGDRDK
jgi:DNA segregation ATPase FtsK/SpoIIIE-like protein